MTQPLRGNEAQLTGNEAQIRGNETQVKPLIAKHT